jgi:hypothetical protein
MANEENIRAHQAQQQEREAQLASGIGTLQHQQRPLPIPQPVQLPPQHGDELAVGRSLKRKEPDGLERMEHASDNDLGPSAWPEKRPCSDLGRVWPLFNHILLLTYTEVVPADGVGMVHQ